MDNFVVENFTQSHIKTLSKIKQTYEEDFLDYDYAPYCAWSKCTDFRTPRTY